MRIAAALLSGIQTAPAWLAPISTGLLVGVAISQSDWHVLAAVALVPMGLSFTAGHNQPTPSLATWLGGAASSAFVLRWMLSCSPNGNAYFDLYIVGWLAASIVSGGFFACMWAYGERLSGSLNLPQAITLPLAWVTFEFALAYGSRLLGVSGSPWMHLAYALTSQDTLLQSVDLFGVFGLSLLIATLNGAIVDLLRVSGEPVSHRLRGVLLPIIAPALAIVAATLYGTHRLTHRGIDRGPSVCLMSERDLPPGIAADRLPQQGQPMLLVWPETTWHHAILESPASEYPSVPTELEGRIRAVAGRYDDYVQRSLLSESQRLNATLVIGCEAWAIKGDTWQRYNAAACVSPHDSQIQLYQKRSLVPWVESLPLGPLSEATYSKGERPLTLSGGVSSRSFRFAPAICYDACFPDHFHSRERDRADFIIQIGAEGVDRSGTLQRRMLDIARIRAIENRRPLVRCVAGGASGIIDGCGRFVEASPTYQDGLPTPVGSVPFDGRWSLYSFAGDTPLMTLCFVTGLWSWLAKSTSYRWAEHTT